MSSDQTTTADATQPAETEQARALSNRARVRTRFIDRLEADGMVRARAASAADHAAFLGKLEGRLGYLTDTNLERLRQLTMALATGTARNVWPRWITIRNHAFALQTPPDPANPIMQTWLHSRRGPQLRDRGELVETYLMLKRLNRPLWPTEEREIAEQAESNRRWRARVIVAIERGTASDKDRSDLAAYDRIADTCNDIVEAGIAHRKALGEPE